MNGTEHIEAAEKLLSTAEVSVTKHVLEGQESATLEALLAVLAHGVIAIAKRTGRA